MAARINKKFLLILTGVVVLFISSAVGIWVTWIHESVSDLIAAGDSFYERGLYGKAGRRYGKAILKDPKNVDLYIKFFDAKSSEPVEFGAPARKAHGEQIMALRAALREEPDNAEAFGRLMMLFMKRGVELNDITAWNSMKIASDSALEVGEIIEAYKYRGVAQVNLLRSQLPMSDEERWQIQKDLETYIESFPDDIDAVFYLALAHLAEAEHLEGEAGIRESDLEQFRQRARAITDQFLLRHPNNIRAKLNHASMLVESDRRLNARPLIAEIENELFNNPVSRRDVRTLINLISAVMSGSPGSIRSEQQVVAANARVRKVLDAAVRASPDDLALKYLYAVSHFGGGEGANSQAIKTYGDIRKVNVFTTPIDAYLQTRVQQMALMREVDLRLNNVERLQPGHGREEALEDLDPLVKEIRANQGEGNAAYNRLVGKFHYMRNEWFDAAQFLQKADEQHEHKHPEVLMRLAVAYSKMNASGAAMLSLERLLQLRGMENYKTAQLQLARLYIKHKQFDDAEKLIKSIEPRDKRTDQMLVLLEKHRGNPDKAIELLQKRNSEKRERTPLAIAEMELMAGRKEKAQAIVEEFFEENLTDTTALRMLIQMSKDKEEAISFVERARGGGGDSSWLDQIEKQLSGEMKPREIIEKRISEYEDEFEKHKARYLLHLRYGEGEAAEAEFVKAEELNPDHWWIIEVTIQRALAEGRWDDARAVAGRAAALNLDRAQGMFYFSRIEMAQGNYRAAVANLREGLKQRPQWAQGWERLGDAQRQAREFVGAIESYKKSLELGRDNVDALRGLAASYDAREQYELALAQLAKAYEYASDSPIIRAIYTDYAQKHGDPEEVLAIRQEIRKSKPKDFRNLHQLALLLASTGDHVQAQEIVEQLIEDHGANRISKALQADVAFAVGGRDEAHQIMQDYMTGLGDKATAEDWQSFGRLLIKIGRGTDAMAAFQRAVELEDPETMLVSRELGMRLFQRGYFREAVEIYTKLYYANQSDQSVASNYIEMLLPLGMMGKAEEVLAQQRQSHGENEATYLLEAMIAMKKSDNDRALTALDEAEKHTPQNSTIYYLRAKVLDKMPGMSALAKQQVARSLELNPMQTRPRLLLARLLKRTGEYQKAIAEMQAVLKRDPDSVDAKVELALLYVATDRNDRARRLLLESIEAMPGEYRWHYHLGELSEMEGKIAEAIKYFARAFDLKPSTQTLDVLVSAMIKAGQTDMALQTLSSQQPMLDEFPMLQHLRGLALARANQQDEAKEAFTTALKACQTIDHVTTVARQMSQGIGPMEALAMLEQLLTGENELIFSFVMSQYLVATAQFEAADERLRRLDELVSADAPLRIGMDKMLAMVKYQTGDYANSRIAYERVLQRNPDDVGALNNAAFLMGDLLGQPEEALVLARRAHELDPRNSEVLDTLGWIEHLNGDSRDAARTLRRSMDHGRTAANCLHLARVLHAVDPIEHHDEVMDLLNVAQDQGKKSFNQKTVSLARKLQDEWSE